MGRHFEHLEDGLKLVLFDSVDELRQELGQPTTRGLFDIESNTIFATPSTVAHEIGHYKDHLSGKMIDWSKLQDKQSQRSARIRNELVAVIYAWKKDPRVNNLHDWEKELLDLVYYELSQDSYDFDSLKFYEIQELADRLSSEDYEKRQRLEFLLCHYLEAFEPPKAYKKCGRS